MFVTNAFGSLALSLLLVPFGAAAQAPRRAPAPTPASAPPPAAGAPAVPAPTPARAIRKKSMGRDIQGKSLSHCSTSRID